MFDKLTIELTNICNLSCDPCPRHHLDMKLGFMTTQLFENLIDQLEPDTVVLPFWRGEPLLHPDARDLLRYLVYAQMKPILATNGHNITTLVTEPIIFRGMKAINVSLHNLDSYSAYLWLMTTKAAYHSDVDIQLSYVENEILEDFPIELLGRLDLRRYKQHSFNGVWGCTNAGPVAYRDWCKRLDDDLVITWDGQVSRCCYVWEPIKGLDANIMSLRDIWNSPQLCEIRDNYPDDICAKCDQWRGGGRTL